MTGTSHKGRPIRLTYIKLNIKLLKFICIFGSNNNTYNFRHNERRLTKMKERTFALIPTSLTSYLIVFRSLGVLLPNFVSCWICQFIWQIILFAKRSVNLIFDTSPMLNKLCIMIM